MTDIIIVGLLLVIIFILISALALECFIYGGLILCLSFLIIAAIISFNSLINDPIGSFWWAVDNNPVISMVTLQTDIFNDISTVQMPPIDPKEWRVYSILTYIFGIVVVGWVGYKFLFPFCGRRKCVE